MLFLVIIAYNCSEDPLTSDFDHSGLAIDTLTIYDINTQNYNVAPNLGTNERLYLGNKNGLDIPVSFIEIANSVSWSLPFDSTIVVDSLRFITYSKDSLLSIGSTPNLFFHPDSQFDENSSTYLDFSGFSNSEWHDLGQPYLRTNSDESDTSSETYGDYLFTELVWDIDTLLHVLADTLDTNQVWSKPDLVRSFAMQFVNSDSNFIELFSEEATTGDRDPKIVMYFRWTYDSGDSTITVDTSRIIYSAGDLSIIEPGEVVSDENFIWLSNGLGLRSVLNLPIAEHFLPVGSAIRSADFILTYDTTLTGSAYNVILDPIESDSLSVDTVNVYDSDPYEAIGYPYRVSTDAENGSCILSLKNIMQNITLGNVTNLGFKLIANEKNDPFESIWFDKGQTMRLEIVYVTNQ